MKVYDCILYLYLYFYSYFYFLFVFAVISPTPASLQPAKCGAAPKVFRPLFCNIPHPSPTTPSILRSNLHNTFLSTSYPQQRSPSNSHSLYSTSPSTLPPRREATPPPASTSIAPQHGLLLLLPPHNNHIPRRHSSTKSPPQRERRRHSRRHPPLPRPPRLLHGKGATVPRLAAPRPQSTTTRRRPARPLHAHRRRQLRRPEPRERQRIVELPLGHPATAEQPGPATTALDDAEQRAHAPGFQRYETKSILAPPDSAPSGCRRRRRRS